MGADCKSVGLAYVGSNPTAATSGEGPSIWTALRRLLIEVGPAISPTKPGWEQVRVAGIATAHRGLGTRQLSGMKVASVTSKVAPSNSSAEEMKVNTSLLTDAPGSSTSVETKSVLV